MGVRAAALDDMLVALLRHIKIPTTVDRQCDCVRRVKVECGQGIQDGRDSESARVYGGELGSWEGSLHRGLAVTMDCASRRPEPVYARVVLPLLYLYSNTKMLRYDALLYADMILGLVHGS